MIAAANECYPLMRFRVGDMPALDVPDSSVGGIVAFISIIHIDRDRVEQACGEMARVVAPSGNILVSLHVGKEELRAEEWFGKAVSFRATLFEPDEMERAMKKAGLEIAELHLR